MVYEPKMALDTSPEPNFLAQDFNQWFFSTDVKGFVEEACSKALTACQKQRNLQASSPQKSETVRKVLKTTKKRAPQKLVLEA